MTPASERSTVEPAPDIEAELAQSDPALGRLITAVVARIGRQRITPARAAPFEALARAIIYQSISAKAAIAIFARLKETLGGALTPAKVLAMAEGSIIAAGLSKSKADAVRNLAAWFAENRRIATALPELPDGDVVEALTAVPGIGAWTVNVFLIFSLGRRDVMPASDLGIRRGVQLVYGLDDVATPKQVHEKAERWRPHRSIASVYLWNAVKLKLGPADLD